MSCTRIVHADATELAQAAATRIAQVLDQSLATRGQAVMALAGGRTAPPIFRQLVAQPRDWGRLTLLPTDERWVPADHVDNNLQQMRAGFGAEATAISWLPLVPDDAAGSPDARFAQDGLGAVAADFDLCMLGMGADGHFASLFPGAPNLMAALALGAADDAVVIQPDPLPVAGAHPRISLTLARLLRCRQLLLVITGTDKLAVLEQALAGADALQLPVVALLGNPKINVEIHWSP